MSDEPCEYSAGDRLVRGKFTEVDLTPRLRMNPRSAEFWYVVVAVIVVALTCWAVVRMDASSGMGPLAAIAVMALLLMAGVGLVGFTREVSSKRIAAELEYNPDVGLQELLLQRARFLEMNVSKIPARLILNTILNIRGGGFTIRSFRKPLPASFVSIPEPFEPHPLDESTPSFRELSGELRSPATGAPKWAMRLIQLCGGWLTVFMITFGIAFYGFLAYRAAWSIGKFGIIVGPILGPWIVMAWIRSRGAYSRIRQWLAVPGGVVIRKARPFRSGWEMQYVRREDGVLLVHKIPNRAWWALVVFSGGQEETHLTEREADFLLRAWLSPVPPPERDRLVELT